MRILELIKKKLIFKHTYNNEEFIKYLSRGGVKVGKNTHFFSPRTVTIDITRPYLLEIGNGVKITANVTILTHDFSYSVLRPVYGELINECSGKTILGDNCFLGMHCIIMPGVRIGKNAIIGSGSVVTADVPDNAVAAGNPAKTICSLEEFYNKRKARLVNDAFRQAAIIREKYNRDPTIEEMGQFYPLYLERDLESIKKNNIRIKLSGDDEEDIIECFLNSTPVFNSYDEFLTASKTTNYEPDR